MSDDERAIRDLIATWMSASQAGDTDTVLGPMNGVGTSLTAAPQMGVAH